VQDRRIRFSFAGSTSNSTVRRCALGAQWDSSTSRYVGLAPLVFDAELAAAARDHSVWMDQTDTFSHT
jgi:uncharacterized protein YkwD